MQDAGVLQAKLSCEQFFSSAGGDSFDQELLDDSDEVVDEASVLKGGQKHRRDPWDEQSKAILKTPRNRSPSSTITPTENIDSPLMVQSRSLPNPFQDNNAYEVDDEELLDVAEEDENNGQDFLLPDKVEQEFHFVGDLDGLDLTIGFQPFFAEVKKKAVYIEDTDEVLGRSGIIFLENGGSVLQQKHFGMNALAQIKEKMLKYWQTADVSASRNKARAWLDLIEDKNYARSEILTEMAKCPPADPIDRNLWMYLMNAVSKFPVKDTTKLYSESTGLSSYALPLCQTFMSDPDKMVFLNFVDKATVSGKNRAGKQSKREPDLVLELKDQSKKLFVNWAKNAKDLARIGLGLKDVLDLVQDKYGIHDATLLGYQVVAQTMGVYIMRCCGNMYIMVHVQDLMIPDSLKELGIIGAEFKQWFELARTVEHGIKPVLEAAAKGEVISAHPSLATTQKRFRTVSTPELNKLLKRV
ncbi:hypothetical protein BGZ94_010260 [Podila epigama]|nr:hypothetical protein BGZ94_010260 [Podila epigama]